MGAGKVVPPEDVTVKVAALLVTLPPPFVTKHWNWVPLSASVKDWVV